MNPSGGLRWHWRAWRSAVLWRPTCEAIADWLAGVQPQARKLLLLGPSAGWMLPTEWLLRFDSVHAVDLDPYAPWLFARRHGAALNAGGTRWHYHRADALIDLPRLLTAHPQACVLFDNLLGQLRFHAPAWQDPVAFTGQRLAQIKRQLQGREWGSVHDLLSGPAQGLPAGQAFPAVRRHVAAPGADRQADAQWLAAAGPGGEWLDHLTDSVFAPGTPIQDMAWPFRPDYWHWLQAGWVQPPAASADAAQDPVPGAVGWNQLPLLQNAFAIDHRAAEAGAGKQRQVQGPHQLAPAVDAQLGARGLKALAVAGLHVPVVQHARQLSLVTLADYAVGVNVEHAQRVKAHGFPAAMGLGGVEPAQPAQPRGQQAGGDANAAA